MKKIILALLCCILASVLCCGALAADIRFGLGDVEDFHSIYMGKYDGKEVEWLVLDHEKTSVGGTGMFLLARDKLYERVLNHWEYDRSGLQRMCREFLDAPDCFTNIEKQTIIPTTKEAYGEYDLDRSVYGPGSQALLDHALVNEKLFNLSVMEVIDYLLNSGEYAEYAKLDKSWYTRTESSYNNSFGMRVISTDAKIERVGDGSYNIIERAFRPAMNIDAEGALAFVSPAVGGKESGVGLYPVSEMENVKAWKLTLLDSSRRFSASSEGVAYSDDRMLEISYENANVGANEYISAIFEDNGELYYGAAAQPEAQSGTMKLALPAELANGSYEVYLFSEQRNGDQRTDYASKAVKLSFTLADRPAPVVPAVPGIPETGDGANLALWMGLMMASASAMAVIIARKKKEY